MIRYCALSYYTQSTAYYSTTVKFEYTSQISGTNTQVAIYTIQLSTTSDDDVDDDDDGDDDHGDDDDDRLE